MKENNLKFSESKANVSTFKLKPYFKTDTEEPAQEQKPERNLVAAIIGRAIVDAYCEAEIPQSIRREAKAWLSSDCCKHMCQILDLNHLAMLKAILKEPQKIIYTLRETSPKFYQKRCKK